MVLFYRPESCNAHDANANIRKNIRKRQEDTLSVVLAGKAGSACVIVDGSAGGIQAKNTQRQTEEGNSDVENGECDLARRGEPLAGVQVQPVDTGQTVAEPTGEEGTDQTVQVAEDGDGLGDNPGDDPAGDAQTEPQADGLPAARVDQVGLCGQAEVDVLQTDVTVHDTGADDGGDGNAVGDLLHERAGGGEGRGLDGITDIVVDDDTGGEVQADLEALEHEEGLLEVLGALHLGDETEESDVGAVGEDNVGDGLEGSVQVGLDGGLDHTAGVLLHGDGDHGDQDGAEDADERAERDPGHAAHSTGNGQHQRDEHADQGKDNGAGAVVGDGVHHDAEGQDVTAHDEDTEQELTSTEQLTAEGSQQDLTGVTQVLDVGVTFTHQTDVVSGIGREETETDDQNDTGDQTQGSHGRGQRQNTQGNGLANHQKTTLPGPG